ncbi:MAG: MBL fold metallo-hydrolase [Bdellovibrio sp.]|nr:MBL fold metallo-hydrolase [Bdellovibrio sp.]
MIKISRILHAGYIFECGETKIAFDPLFENPFSRNCHAFPNVEFDQAQIRKQKFDAVFISHFHDDHCSFESLNLLNRTTPIYIYCPFPEMFVLLSQLGFSNLISLEIDKSVKIGEIEIIPRRALDADVDSIFHIKAADLNILNVVDSWIDQDTLQLIAKTAWDMVLWPFQTMREIEVIAPSRAAPAPEELPGEWVEQLKILSPKYIVPSSCQFSLEKWSWYNHAFFPISYQQFTTEVEKIIPTTKVIRMNPSVSFLLSKDSLHLAPPISWIKTLGEQNVDYHYQPQLEPPPTSEISTYFAALTSAETEKVYDYCHHALIDKFNSMEDPLDNYFSKPRFWKLSIFDHLGTPQDFYYKLHKNQIEISAVGSDKLSWSTEVPISKLYAALELGESLSSMYMRINDIVFDPEIELEISNADIVEDPLIRCLFNGVFGAYQIAQLKRIQYG